jgi:hypothetical protein
MTYTVSWLAQTTKAVIQRRSWWNLFGKDALLPVTGWKRHVVTTDKNLTLKHCDLLFPHSNQQRI